MNRTELTKEQIDKINSGLVVQADNGLYYVVNDNDGSIYAPGGLKITPAQLLAFAHGQNVDIITPGKYKNKFGKEFSY